MIYFRNFEILDIPASAAYLSVYEYLKKKFSGEGAQRTLSPGATLLAGGLAGMANWWVLWHILGEAQWQ